MALEDLLLILFLLLPLLSRLFGKKQQPRQPAPPQDDEREAYREPVAAGGRREEEDSLSEALRQIREALGEPAPSREPKPEPVPEPRPVAPAPLPEPRPIPKEPIAASSPVPRRGPIQQKAVGPSRLAGAAESRLTRPVDLGAPLEVERVAAGSAFNPQELVARLRTGKAAREAFLMKEILDRPLGARRGHR